MHRALPPLHMTLKDTPLHPREKGTRSKQTARRSRPSCSTHIAYAGLLALACFSLLIPDQVRADTIAWRVERPFRLFNHAGATVPHAFALEGLSQSDRSTPVLSMERVLSEAHARGWAAATVDGVCFSDVSDRYACREQPDYVHPTDHDVIVRLSQQRRGDCVWTLLPKIGARRNGPTRTEKPCADIFVASIPFPDGADITVARDGIQIAAASIRVRDVFIVGIGDSYAAGDGNPDVPVRLDDTRSVSYRGPEGLVNARYPARSGSWRRISEPGFGRAAARWLAPACHRSLYGHQVRAALQLALEDPHRAVTFVGFACWGAEIIDGVFLPISPNDAVPNMPRLSQLSAVVDAQCRPGSARPRDWPATFDVDGALPELAALTLLHCPRQAARRIDLLLVTVGGNDVGFAQLVANAVLQDGSPLRAIGKLLGQVKTARQSLDQLADLERRAKALNRAAHLVLQIPWNEPDRIVLTAYPPIAQAGSSDLCPSGRDGMTVLPGFSLDQTRARQAEVVGERLNDALARIARNHGWAFVDAHRRLFETRGFCVGSRGPLAAPADEGRLPMLTHEGWRPYPPSQWQPYASRQRWIRSPNDGFLTVNFHVDSQGDKAPNLLLASSYSGAFHPTAEGQAAIADAAVAKARRVLDKYRK